VLFLSGAVQRASAQTTAPSLPDQIAQARSALAHDDAKLAAASSAGAAAKSHYDFLVSEIFAPIKQDLAIYNSDALTYNRENSAAKSAMSQHNANQCTAAECEASYNAERDQLDAEATQMASRKAALDQRRDGLNARFDILSNEGRTTAQTAKQALADYAQALSDRTTMSAELAALKPQSADCKARLRTQGQSSSDVLIAQCGDDQYNLADKALPPPPPALTGDMVATINSAPIKAAELRFSYDASGGQFSRRATGTVTDVRGFWNALEALQAPPGAHGAYGLIGDDNLLGKEPGYGLRQLGSVARQYVTFDTLYVVQPSGWEQLGVQTGTFTDVQKMNDTTLGWVLFDLRAKFEADLKSRVP
jgi:hypothetical protein